MVSAMQLYVVRIKQGIYFVRINRKVSISYVYQ